MGLKVNNIPIAGIGIPGKDGVTYTPSIENGILSWTNNGGLKNPPDTYIPSQEEVNAMLEELASKVHFYTYSQTDLEAGMSELETGKLYFVYEWGDLLCQKPHM